MSNILLFKLFARLCFEDKGKTFHAIHCLYIYGQSYLAIEEVEEITLAFLMHSSIISDDIKYACIYRTSNETRILLASSTISEFSFEYGYIIISNKIKRNGCTHLG